MANLTRATTAAEIGLPYPLKSEVYDFVAAEAIEAGQPLYELTDGTVGVADANASGKFAAFAGIALRKCPAKGTVSVLQRGHCVGLGVSGLNCGALVYLSDDVGMLGDAAGTNSVVVGKVTMLPTGVKSLFVETPRRS